MLAVKRLIIDVGTNSVLALLAEVDGDSLKVISDGKSTTKLGEGLSASRNLSPDAMQRTLKAIQNFISDNDHIEILILGTEALRRAYNSKEFVDSVLNATGNHLNIISGDIEAELSFRGALYDLQLSAPNIVLIDVGGGSTEIVFARKGVIEFIKSIPLGALKLKELCKPGMENKLEDQARPIFNKEFDSKIIPKEFQVIATGGTITSLAAIRQGLKDYRASQLHGSSLNTTEITAITARFESANPTDRPKLIPFDPQRADLILPGAGIFLALMSIMHKNELTVSVGGLRFGAALFPHKIPNYSI